MIQSTYASAGAAVASFTTCSPVPNVPEPSSWRTPSTNGPSTWKVAPGVGELTTISVATAGSVSRTISPTPVFPEPPNAGESR